MKKTLDDKNLFYMAPDQLPVAFGGASISGEGKGYGFGEISEVDSIDLLEEAFEAGIRVFDSAPIYGFGLSEHRMGKAFKSKRENVFLISKSGVSWHDSKRVNMSNDPVLTQKMLEQSLRDLSSDYIDLYMVHWPDERVDIRKTLEVLVKAQDQSKIKYIGLCNTNRDEIEKAQEVAQIEIVQAEWSPLAAHNAKLRSYVVSEDMKWMSWGCFDKGILTGRVSAKRVFDSSDCRSWAPWWKAMDKEKKYLVVEALESVLRETEFNLVDFATAFQSDDIADNMAIYGVRSSQQLQSLCSSLKKQFPPELMINCLEKCYEL